MRKQTDKLILGLAFALAVALHAALLPWVGQAVGGREVEPSPDWAITDIQAPTQSLADQQIQMDVLVQDLSETVLASDPQRLRHDEIYLSRDRKIDPHDVLLDRFKARCVSTWVDLGGPRLALDTRLGLTLGLPADADGPYHLIYHADADNELPDRDRSNNTRTAPIYIDGPQTPELSIDTFDAPERATPGGSIFVDFKVKNIGKGWAASGSPLRSQSSGPHWTDRVYLSQNDTLDATDLALRTIDRHAPLGPGDTYEHEQIELAIPRGVTGPMYLIITADADQVLDQPSFTAGLAVQKIELVDSGAPDLVVAMLEKPDRLVVNRPTQVAYSIGNLGGVSTDEAKWTDGFYLSQQPELDDSAVPITQVESRELLEARSRYTGEAEVTLPESITPGQWYLIAKADAGDAIDERGFDDNNTLAVPVIVLTQKQADAEIQLGAPDRPERMVVQWIEHERVEEHRARLSRTVQPALQDKADPVPDAPLVDNPRPPVVAQKDTQSAGDPQNPQRTIDPTNQQAATPKPTAPDATQTDTAPRPQTPGSQPPTRIDGLPGTDGELKPQRPGIDDPNAPNTPAPIDPTPGTDATPTPKPGERDVTSPADPTAPDTDRTTDSQTPSKTVSDTDSNNPDDNDANQLADQQADTNSDEQTDNADTNEPSKTDGQGDSDSAEQDKSTTAKPSEDQSAKPDGKPADPATPSEPQTPTRAPRDDSEAPPVDTRTVEVALQEGKVLVGEGIKVTPKMPTPPGTGARTLSLPRNARVRITFTSDGKAYEAKVIKSTNYKEWDAAIEASLYRWTAEGDAVKNAEPYIVIEWNYLLNDLMGDE